MPESVGLRNEVAAFIVAVARQGQGPLGVVGMRDGDARDAAQGVVLERQESPGAVADEGEAPQGIALEVDLEPVATMPPAPWSTPRSGGEKAPGP